MNFNLKRRAYERLPVALKRVIGLVPFAWLAGPAYRRRMRRVAWLDRASRAELRAFQDAELKRTLEFAADQVPAYQRLRSTVSRLGGFEALKAFPIVDKETLQSKLPDYLPRDLEQIPHYQVTTGGTSGNQLSFYVDNDSQAIEMAFMHRLWRRVGYLPRHRKATFRGVEFGDVGSGRYWQPNPVYNELQMSPYHLNETSLPAYIQEMASFRPMYLHGYPSALVIVARYLARHPEAGKDLDLRAALLSSEAVYPDQREVIEQAFRCRAFSWYGHSERIILAGECEQSTAYHVFPDYGIAELLDETGELVDEPGGRGELVGTGLFNRSMPLVRYRTGDFARKLDERCECGRHWDRFDEVEGRWLQEYVIGRHGSRISPAALNMHGKLFDHVLRYQYVQDRPGIVELHVMHDSRFSVAEEQALLAAFRRKLGDELEFEIRRVANIPLTSRGKLRRLIQNLPEA